MTHWTWRFETREGKLARIDFDPPDFTSQSDAESWIGEAWRQLADIGVAQVRLYEEGREVYGPMSLDAG